jgi:hypothetical protein
MEHWCKWQLHGCGKPHSFRVVLLTAQVRETADLYSRSRNRPPPSWTHRNFLQLKAQDTSGADLT